jgi:outer membrane protein assembly factor BamB
VAADERVYVTLGIEAPVTALDAATGQTVHTYQGTDKTEEIIFSDGTLFLLISDVPFRQPANPSEYSYDQSEGARHIVAVDAATGDTLWNQPQSGVRPLTLAATGENVLFSDGHKIVCLDRADGRRRWTSDPVEQRRRLRSFFAPTLVVYRDVIFYSGGLPTAGDHNYGGDDNQMYALSADTGRILWTADHPRSGYMSPEDILVVDNLVWTPHNTLRADSGAMIGRDPKTGEMVRQFLPDVETYWFHHRCHRSKATDRYILTSRTGIEFIDPETEHWICNHWVRGACLYGVMPANGMIYNPPHPCACYTEAKLYGLNALAPESPTRQVPRQPLQGKRLKRGPAYNESVSDTSEPADWPTYRADAGRSGYVKTTVPADLKIAWETDLGGRLSSLVAADGKVFVASIDTHRIHALDARSGKSLWHYTTGGRIDSPPTIWRGRVLLGSADGHVYCLRVADGELIWRFRAAPVDRRMGAFEQIESVWPVHGSVLVRDGELWCVAGRSMFVDGGLRLLRLEAATGRMISETIMDDRDPQTDENLQVRLKSLDMPVALPDVLSCDGKYVYMRSQRFDHNGIRQEIEVPTLDVTAQYDEGPHLFCPTGFLDDIWWHRSYWVFGRVFKSGAGGYFQTGRVAPAGRPLVFNDTTVYGYGRKPKYYRWTTPMEYQLFATAKRPKGIDGASQQGPSSREQRRRGQAKASDVIFDWTQDVPVLVRAMVLANKTLFIAGPPDLLDEERSLQTFDQAATQKQLARQADALEGAEGAWLWAVSAADGTKLTEHKLESVPVFDGMVAAAGRLYMATSNGKVVCLSGR